MDGSFWEAWAAAEAAQAAYVKALPGWVHGWMLFMTIVLNLSLLFVPWRWPARWTILVAALTPFLATLLIVLFGNGVPPGFGHLLTWTPLAVYCGWSLNARMQGRVPMRLPVEGVGIWPALVNIGRRRWFETAFRVWLAVCVAILIASLIFDARTAILRLT